MCGISCLLSLSAGRCERDRSLLEPLQRRGPDSSRDVTVTGPNSSYQCLFSAHLLHMRGLFTPQPVQDHAGNILMWNGEIFGGLEVTPEENDTDVACRRLSSCGTPSQILSVLSGIQGPWGLVYYQRAEDFLWFGRDFFGRRSLLWKFEEDLLTLTSVGPQVSAADGSKWKEIPAVGVFRLNLKEAAGSGSLNFEVFPWSPAGLRCENLQQFVPGGCTAFLNPGGLVLKSPVCSLNTCVLNEAEPRSDSPVKDLEDLLRSRESPDEVTRLIHVLSEAVKKRVQAPPFRAEEPPSDAAADVAVLFSGGLDSMVLAALADRHVPAHKPIDLLNVAFQLRQEATAKNPTSDPFGVPDRLSGRAGLKELQELNPDRRWRFIEINVTLEELQRIRQERICPLIHPLDTVLDDSIGCAVWFAARGAGVEGHRAASSAAKVRP